MKYALEITMSFRSGRDLVWKRWYGSERARDTALAHFTGSGVAHALWSYTVRKL